MGRAERKTIRDDVKRKVARKEDEMKQQIDDAKDNKLAAEADKREAERERRKAEKDEAKATQTLAKTRAAAALALSSKQRPIVIDNKETEADKDKIKDLRQVTELEK